MQSSLKTRLFLTSLWDFKRLNFHGQKSNFRVGILSFSHIFMLRCNGTFPYAPDPTESHYFLVPQREFYVHFLLRYWGKPSCQSKFWKNLNFVNLSRARKASKKFANGHYRKIHPSTQYYLGFMWVKTIYSISKFNSFSSYKILIKYSFVFQSSVASLLYI